MQDLVAKKPQQRKKTCIIRKSRLTTKHEYLPSVNKKHNNENLKNMVT